jgi:branched-chain amino acid transport system permease protein
LQHLQQSVRQSLKLSLSFIIGEKCRTPAEMQKEMADLLSGGGQLLGQAAGNRGVHGFGFPLHVHVSMFPAVFSADHLLAVAGAVGAVLGVTLFLARTEYGVALRAAASNSDRAQLAGIPVARLSSLTWALAACLAALAVVLRVPVHHITAAQQLAVGGTPLLVRALAAAVVAGMERLPLAAAAAVAIGVIDEAATWTTSRTTYADALLVVIILVALLLQRDAFTRSRRTTGPEWRTLGRNRPLPPVLATLPEVRWGRRGLIGFSVGAAVLLPAWAGPRTVSGATLVVIYGVAALSLVPLVGWAGQISLGQWALAGFGGATTALLYQRHGLDLLLALPAGVAVSAVAAAVVGLPALRVRGPYLAVTTLAFALTSSTYLFDGRFFGWFVQDTLDRPALWGRLPLTRDWQMYEACLVGLVLAVAVVTNVRRSRTGRAIVAARDNPAAAGTTGLSTTRLTLTAFVLSGALAGFAGGLYVLQQQGFHTDAFDHDVSIRLFAMVVIGGLGSVPGALLGAVYVRGADLLLPPAWAALSSGAGLLVLLLILPDGLGGALTRGRDALLHGLARRRGLSIGGPTHPSDDVLAAGALQ